MNILARFLLIYIQYLYGPFLLTSGMIFVDEGTN